MLLLAPAACLAVATSTLTVRLAQPAEFNEIAKIRTDVFSQHLTTPGSKYLQVRKFGEGTTLSAH